MYYVYILKLNDNSPYTGCTEDLKARIDRHQKGYVPATKNKLPVQLHSYLPSLTSTLHLILNSI